MAGPVLVSNSPSGAGVTRYRGPTRRQAGNACSLEELHFLKREVILVLHVCGWEYGEHRLSLGAGIQQEVLQASRLQTFRRMTQIA